jgi:hypothetical protein
MSELPETSDPQRVPAARPLLDHVRLLALSGAGVIAFSSTLVRLSKASPSTAAIFRCARAPHASARRRRPAIAARSREAAII